MRGSIDLTVTDVRTREVIDTFRDHNQIVDTHMDILIKRIYENNPGDAVRWFKIGSDIGATGTPNDPELAHRKITNDDHINLFATQSNIEISYNGPREITYNIFLHGPSVMDAFPGKDHIHFNSMGLFTENDQVFAYKRFPERSINDRMNINIHWTLYFELANDRDNIEARRPEGIYYDGDYPPLD